MWLVERAEILDAKLGFILREPLSLGTLVKTLLSHQTRQLQGYVEVRENMRPVSSLLLAQRCSNNVTRMTMAIVIRLTMMQARLTFHLQQRLNSDPSAKM